MLDSFAGSGTTGHAVLEQNKADGRNRRFIRVQIEDEVCQRVTAQRIARVITGYRREAGNGNAVDVEGLRGGFSYCKLGDALFDEAAGENRFDGKVIAGSVNLLNLLDGTRDSLGTE